MSASESQQEPATGAVERISTGAPPPGRSMSGPTQPGQRIQTIDVLRGFALFGILLVNMAFFNTSALTKFMAPAPPHTLLDQLAEWFIAFFAQGKFYSTFSFLFGLGMAIQFARAREQGARFGPFWLRRMLALLVFGLIHAYFFWIGDILILYSVLGLVLLIFRNCRPRTLLIWAVVCLLAPIVLNAALLGLVSLGRAAPGGEEMMARALEEQMAGYRAAGAEANRIYATGTFAEITALRAREMTLMFSVLPFMAFNVLAMMLLGLYAGQRRIFQDIPGHLPLIRRTLVWGLIVGLVGNALYVFFGESSTRSLPSPALVLSIIGQTIGAPALSLFYMAGLTLLAERPAWRRRLTPLSYVGRMALTNYLMQSLICTTLFYGYGFGLFGQIGAAGGILLTVAIYAIEVVWSAWWLRRFRFGPMEWLWRVLSYGRRQPMRIE